MKVNSIFRTISSVKWQEFALDYGYCPVCSVKRVMVKLYDNEIAVRCLACRATSVTMSLVTVLRKLAPTLHNKDVYELSSRGPLFRFLQKNCRTLTYSEYFEGIPSGEYHNGILCQDVQHLNFKDNSFDICTSTEVFEHVPDDLAGFAEIRRVLRPGGIFLFTVPLFNYPKTVERAMLDKNGGIKHLLPCQYHGDPIRGHKPILVFRDYGEDIKQRIVDQGFNTVQLLSPVPSPPWDYKRTVIAAF